MKSDKRLKFPCKDCITLSICNSMKEHPYYSLLTVLIIRCSIFKEYYMSVDDSEVDKNCYELFKQHLYSKQRRKENEMPM